MDPEKIVYCPRCDRLYYSDKSHAESMRIMEEHLKKAHPDYLPMYED